VSEPLTIPGYQPAEIDLWGVRYVSLPATRTVIQKTEAAQEKAISATDNDDAVAALAAVIDLRLKPVVAGSRRASTLIKDKWKNDELTIDQLTTFLQRLEVADRPT